jgi:hypothetical protein
MFVARFMLLFEERIAATAVRKLSADRYLKTEGNKISGV